MNSIMLQVSWFVDFVPPWLGLALIISGAIPVILQMQNIQEGSNPSVFLSWIGLAMLLSGTILGFYHSYLNSPLVMVVILGSAGRYIEGIAAVRLYQKVSHMIRERSPPSGHTTGLKVKLLFKLAAVFTVISIGWIIVFLMIWGSLDVPYEYALALFWTLSVVCLSSFGLLVKLWGVREEIPLAAIVGFTLIITGSEIYNFATLRRELTGYVIVTLAYSVGFWIAALRLARGERRSY